jgi:hypothetical protein
MNDAANLAPGVPGVDPGDFVRFHDVDVVRAGVNIRLAP